MLRTATASCAALLPALTSAQVVSRLDRPAATFPDPFTQIASVHELRDGRVIVLDRRDRLVVLVDFRSGAATPVGRNGTGPGEYVQPGRLFTLPNDTTAIYDGPARRFIVVSPGGRTGETFRMDVATGAGQRRGGVPRGSDASGRIFTEGSPYAAGELRAADSTPVTRFARDASSGDTIAWVHLDKESIQIQNASGGGVSVSNGVRAFAWRDDWVALADGGVAVVRVSDYHVDWVSPTGARSAGVAIMTRQLPVTNADKEQARKDMLEAMRGATARSRPGSPPPRLPNDIRLPELTFPEFKPAFEVGATVARQNGEVWVLRSRPANEKVAIYDVFTRAGGLVRRVAFPESTRLIGFGNGTVYGVRVDDDGLQYLERWNDSSMRR